MCWWQDGKRTAQFEHTLLMTEEGVVPLTGKVPEGLPGASPLYHWERGAPYTGRGVPPPNHHLLKATGA